MEKDTAFIYSYSAKENKEVQEIRKKYLPQEESKLDELKRLDSAVQPSGMTESLCAGIGGALVFGMGLCLAMKIIGSRIFFMIIGVLLGIVGMIGMLSAYPVYRRVYNKTKEKYSLRILELAEELSKTTI